MTKDQLQKIVDGKEPCQKTRKALLDEVKGMGCVGYSRMTKDQLQKIVDGAKPCQKTRKKPERKKPERKKPERKKPERKKRRQTPSLRPGFQEDVKRVVMGTGKDDLLGKMPDELRRMIIRQTTTLPRHEYLEDVLDAVTAAEFDWVEMIETTYLNSPSAGRFFLTEDDLKRARDLYARGKPDPDSVIIAEPQAYRQLTTLEQYLIKLRNLGVSPDDYFLMDRRGLVYTADGYPYPKVTYDLYALWEALLDLARRGCTKQTSRKFTSRDEPPFKARMCPDVIMIGNDGHWWKSVTSKRGRIWRRVRK